MTDIKSSLELWRAHFNATLNCDDTNNPANEMIRPSRPTTLDNTTPVAPPDRAEVAITIQRLKCKKASGYDGLPPELFKAGVDELVRCMHHLLCNIWSLERMPSVIGVLVYCAQYSKRAMPQSAAIIVA